MKKKVVLAPVDMIQHSINMQRYALQVTQMNYFLHFSEQKAGNINIHYKKLSEIKFIVLIADVVFPEKTKNNRLPRQLKDA